MSNLGRASYQFFFDRQMQDQEKLKKKNTKSLIHPRKVRYLVEEKEGKYWVAVAVVEDRLIQLVHLSVTSELSINITLSGWCRRRWIFSEGNTSRTFGNIARSGWIVLPVVDETDATNGRFEEEVPAVMRG
jgi:hypothetical protein